MELIVAVYDHWGIGKDGTQPVALSADRRFFRETTRGAAVIAGSRTVEDFPGKKPLPGRRNLLLTRSQRDYPGFTVCRSLEQLLQEAQKSDRAFVIGGGTVYRQLLPYCSQAYVTRVHCSPECDTFFPNLEEDPQWMLAGVLERGEEDGVSYDICLYTRK